jgi:hypothetical protein
MKTVVHTGLAWLVVCVSSVMAQQPRTVRTETSPAINVAPSTPSGYSLPSLSSPPVTPELWVYSQELRRHDDPAQAVRRKAEIQADQRLARLAAMKWYGLSNSRPVANPTPYTGQYSPQWIGNGYDRYDWVGPANPSVTLYLENISVTR